MKILGLILGFLITSTLFFGLIMVVAPYSLYERALYVGLDNDFIRFEKANPDLIAPKVRDFSRESENDHHWEVYHFSHFDLPLPAHHREFMLIPVVEEYEDYLSLGGIFYGLNQREFVRFRMGETTPFRINLGLGLVFEMPVFSSFIASKTDEEIWRDLFTLDLELPSPRQFVLFRLKELFSISYHELVYRLSIYELRRNLLPEEAVSLSYYADRGIGVVEIEEEGVNDTQVLREQLDPEVYNEVFFVLAQNHVHRVRLRTHLYEETAQDYRSYLLENLQYRYSNSDSSFPLYARYRSLGHRDRVDQRGMTYLFAGWSHVPDKKEYLREMIHQLERGRSHARHLAPLYQYALRKYETNFSSIEERLIETADQKARRHALEQRGLEREELINREISSEGIEPQGEERIQLFLRRAKSEGIDGDREEPILIEY